MFDAEEGLKLKHLIDVLICFFNDFISFAVYVQYITVSMVDHQAAQGLLCNFSHSSLTVIIVGVLQSSYQCRRKTHGSFLFDLIGKNV